VLEEDHFAGAVERFHVLEAFEPEPRISGAHPVDIHFAVIAPERNHISARPRAARQTLHLIAAKDRRLRRIARGSRKREAKLNELLRSCRHVDGQVFVLLRSRRDGGQQSAVPVVVYRRDSDRAVKVSLDSEALEELRPQRVMADATGLKPTGLLILRRGLDEEPARSEERRVG